MHLDRPRISPVPEAEWSEAQRAQLAPMAERGPVLNIFKTLARDGDALKAFLAWGSYVLSRKNALSPREREIVILRIGYLCRSGYEWTQHTRIGLGAGLKGPEIEKIKQGRAAGGWSEAEAALLDACDDLHRRQFIGDEIWARLRTHYSEKQCMDVVFTAGQYTQVSMILNTFGVQLDEGQTLDPDLKAS